MLQSDIRQAIQQAMAAEHTSYASTKTYLSRLPTKGKHVIQGPGENAGIVDIGKGYAIAFRIESHNHPSFIQPYHGAASGVGGILRDIFTMGARPIGVLDLLRFGTDKKSKQIREGVVKGIADYGNCVGVPTIGGEIYFDKTYNHNCLVNVAAFGLVRKKRIIYGNALTPGSDVIYVGAKTGRDGIGGAQMASENIAVADTHAVQKADPFLEKLLLDACCDIAATDYIEGMQDMGAAGILCSTSEVAFRGQQKTKKPIGVTVYLNKIPIKSSHMSPIDILLSESQERMLIVGKREYREKILAIFHHWDLEAHVIGKVTNDGMYTIVYDDEQKKDLSLSMPLENIFSSHNTSWNLISWKSQKSIYKKASQKEIRETWHQYDWSVGTRTIKGPNKSGSYAILDIPEVNKELVITWSSDKGISDKNSAKGIAYAFYRCVKRMKKCNATPLGITNCLNFGHPRESMGAFVSVLEELRRLCTKTNIPIVSGNVSLYNCYKRHSIKPTPILVMIGIRPTQ